MKGEYFTKKNTETISNTIVKTAFTTVGLNFSSSSVTGFKKRTIKAPITKREIVFKTVGGAERWKSARKALKDAGIRVMEASSQESEMPLCSCGPKIDRRNYGPYGWIDRRAYYIAVRPEDVARARAVLLVNLLQRLAAKERLHLKQ